MAELCSFQDVVLPKPDIFPISSSISSDSLTLIVACSDNNVYVYKRDGLKETFEFNSQVYKGHGDSKITAISVQEKGRRAVSGDEEGFVHLWETTDCSEVHVKHVALCRTVSLAVSENYILASFFHEERRNGQMALIFTGKEESSEWVMVRKVTGIISHVTVSEYGKPKVPQIVYYTNGTLVYDRDPSNDLYTTRAVFKKDTPPWCIKRNKGAGFLAFSIYHGDELIIWAPQEPPSKSNPFILNLNSEEAIKINESLSVSSVVSYKMFLASIFDKKLKIITASRAPGNDGEGTGDGEDAPAVVESGNKPVQRAITPQKEQGAEEKGDSQVKKIVKFDLNPIDSNNTSVPDSNEQAATPESKKDEGNEGMDLISSDSSNKNDGSIDPNTGSETTGEGEDSSAKTSGEDETTTAKLTGGNEEREGPKPDFPMGNEDDVNASNSGPSVENKEDVKSGDKEDDEELAIIMDHRFWGLF